jgi:peptide deformylase
MNESSIIRVPDKRLTTKSTKVTTFDPELISNLKKMKGILENPNAWGISGPQIGWNKRVFRIRIPASHNPEDLLVWDSDEAWDEIIINPQILEKEEDKIISAEEQCLSLPGVKVVVPRPWQITVKYQDLQQRWQTAILSGLHSRVFQHEFDHLNGILITDYGREA